MRGIRIKRGLMGKVKPMAKRELKHFYRNVIGSVGGGAVVVVVATPAEKAYSQKVKSCATKHKVRLSDSPGKKAQKLRKFNKCMKKGG